MASEAESDIAKLNRRVTRMNELHDGTRGAAPEAQRASEQQLMLLLEASSALLASPKSHGVLETVLQLGQQFIEASAYAVWRRQSATEWRALAMSGLSASFQTMAMVPPGVAIPEEPVELQDLDNSPFVWHRTDVYRREGIQSLLIVPLRIHGTLQGSVTFYYRTPHKNTEQQKRMAAALGNLAAAALGTAELYDRQTAPLEASEQATQRATLLAEASAMLSSSLEYETTLANVARLAVPQFADWCCVDILDERGNLQRVSVQHSDPEKIRFAYEYSEKYPEDEATIIALRTGKSIFVPEIPHEAIAQRVRNPQQLALIRKVGLTSVILAPMVIGGESLGLISFIHAESGRHYDRADLQVAEEIASRAATAIAHARLYEQARASENRLQLATSAARLGVWDLDFATEQMTASDQFKINLGLQSDDELNFGVLRDRILEEDRKRWHSTVLDAMEKRTPFECEYRIYWPDGTLHWLLVYGCCYYSDHNRPYRMVGVSMDITERKRAEEERRELLAREQRARQTAQLLNRVGPALAAELDLERLMQAVTDLATKLIGADFGALYQRESHEKGGDLFQLYTVSGIPRELFAATPLLAQLPSLAPTFTRGRIVRIDDLRKTAAPAQNSPNDGPAEEPPVWRSYLSAPVLSRSGSMLGVLVFGHGCPDVFTAQQEELILGISAQAAIAIDNAKLFDEVRLERERVLETNRALKRSNDSLRQFAYAAAHDLKEPLRMVGLYSQLMGRAYSGKMDAQAEQYLNYMQAGATRMQMLVDDLLAFTQAGDTLGHAPEPVDLNITVRTAIDNLQAAIRETGATISTARLPLVMAHEGPMIQLFQNLISNAIRYHKPGEAPQIDISATARTRDWLLTVQDNGVGIDPRYHQQVFGIFKRLHHDDNSGTGIGLAICQRVVERYGGSIWVESNEGSGSRFLFTLPKELQ